jgi:hypothetical protein
LPKSPELPKLKIEKQNLTAETQRRGEEPGTSKTLPLINADNKQIGSGKSQKAKSHRRGETRRRAGKIEKLTTDKHG